MTHLDLASQIRLINSVFNIGLLVWQLVVISLLASNCRRVRSKTNYAILYIFLCWALARSWEIAGTFVRIGPEQTEWIVPLLLVRLSILIVSAVAVTNFMFVLYGNNIKRLLRQWVLTNGN